MIKPISPYSLSSPSIMLSNFRLSFFSRSLFSLSNSRKMASNSPNSFPARSIISNNPLFNRSSSFINPSRLSVVVRFSSEFKGTENEEVSSEFKGREDKEVLVQHLLLEEKDVRLLMDLLKEVAKGMDLGDLASEFSICPSKETGGMLGWIRRGQTVPEFEEAAFKAPLNTVVRCKTKFGWHLLQVLSEREECALQDISPEDLHKKLQDPTFINEAQLIDVREPDEVEQASLPGFKMLPLRQFGTWGAVITDEFDPAKDTYILCHHGVRSMQVAKWLQSQGFKRLFNVAGGINAYSLKADSSIPTY